MATNWRIDSAADPKFCVWGDEVVVHHALSNDTYRLSAQAGRVLAELSTAAAAGTTSPVGWAFDPGDAEIQDTLLALAELGLVTPC
jgi:hypothetical protein